MSSEKAKAYFLGKDGSIRLNCAQSIISAFKDKFSLSEDVVKLFADYGGGRAPEGVCGAFYAAKYLFQDISLEKVKICQNALLSKAGSLKCKEIRSLGRLTCLGCVGEIGKCLED